MKPKPKITITGLSEKSGLHRATVRLRLKDAGLYPPAGHSLKKLLAALEPDPKEESQAAERARLRHAIIHEKWRGLKHTNDRTESSLIARAIVATAVRKIDARMQEMISRKIETEYPAAVAGLDVPAARQFGKRFADELREEIRAMGDLWGDN
ncbi:MAG: hypothetical protein EB141_19965 [Verrucomicrobia bacterium]|nr:hypothetical protein [Verrucomicrobiota bacterium]NDD40497.1 hypothetical protein [Verrucomicrobiota bacterium]NDF00937.1 hypothetical protein [Verrucomicrobiota bacterium]